MSGGSRRQGSWRSDPRLQKLAGTSLQRLCSCLFLIFTVIVQQRPWVVSMETDSKTPLKNITGCRRHVGFLCVQRTLGGTQYKSMQKGHHPFLVQKTDIKDLPQISVNRSQLLPGGLSLLPFIVALNLYPLWTLLKNVGFFFFSVIKCICNASADRKNIWSGIDIYEIGTQICENNYKDIFWELLSLSMFPWWNICG